MERKFTGSGKERVFFHNTLLCLVHSLQNKNITVDLRNDTYVCGNLDSVDGFMNLTLSKVVYCDPQGNEFALDNLFIQSRNIRYVHIPENISIMQAVRSQLVKPKRLPGKKATQQSRKGQKALKLHMQVVASLEN